MSLKEDAVLGVKWVSISQIGRSGLQWITTIILARLLSPSDYGLMSMAIVWITFTTVLKDLGTSAAVIQREELSDAMLSSIFWVNAGFGFTSMVTLYFLSPLVALLYHEPRVANILSVLSICSFISSLSVLHQAKLERDLAFSKLAKVELCAVTTSSMVGIGLALLKFGVWSLVFKSIMEAVSITVMLWSVTGWRPKMTFRWAEIKSIANFSLNLAGYHISNYFSRNFDYILIGRFLGAQDLGYYTLAYRIMFFPLENITNMLGRVAFPVYSKLKHDNAAFRQAYLYAIGAIAIITFPMMLGLMTICDLFVITLLGVKWVAVSSVLFILAPVGLIHSIGNTAGGIYTAKGRTDWMFLWGLASGFVIITSFIVGLRWGIIGVATAYAIATAILMYPNLAIPFTLIDLQFRKALAILSKPFFCSVFMVIVVLGLKVALTTNLSRWHALAVLVLAGGISYLFANFAINKDSIIQFLDMAGIRLGPIFPGKGKNK